MANSTLLGLVDPSQLLKDLNIQPLTPALELVEAPALHERLKVEAGAVVVSPPPELETTPGASGGQPKAATYRIQFAGIYCQAETFSDGGSDSDEPYVLFTVFTKGEAGAPAKVLATRSDIYQNVHDGIDSGDDWGPLPPLLYVFGANEPQPAEDIGIVATVMEHDHGDPDKFKAVIQQAVSAAAAGVTAWTGYVVPGEVQTLATTAVNTVVDSGDDPVGTGALELSASQFPALAALPLTPWKHQLRYHFLIECSGGHARYWVAFRVVQDPPATSAGWEWNRVGGQFKGSPAITARTPSRRDVFVHGMDDRLWQCEWVEDSGWSAWRSDDPDGGVASGVTAISAGPDVLEVYCRGTEGNAWSRAWHADGGWQAWFNLGGQIQEAPAACARTFATRDVVIWGTDGYLWYAHFNGSTWTDWQRLNVAMTSAPSICAVDANTFDVYFRGPNDALHQISATASGWWAAPIAHDGKLTSAPIAVCPDPSRRDILARGADGALWHKRWHHAAGWQAWERCGGEISAAPGGIFVGGLLDVVVRDNDGALSNAWRGG